MKNVALGFFSAVVFGIGLVVGGMLDTNNVVAFLDIAGEWDPRLAFVMGGAIGVFMPAYRVFRARALSTDMAAVYHLPKLPVGDPKLVVGAILFGMGWALVGYCPGPALVALGSAMTGHGTIAAVTFSLAMVVGMILHRIFASAALRLRTADGIDE